MQHKYVKEAEVVLETHWLIFTCQGSEKDLAAVTGATSSVLHHKRPCQAQVEGVVRASWVTPLLSMRHLSRSA